MQHEVLLQFTVIRGIDLPKTELTSKIDAYVKVQCGSFAGKTNTVDNDSNPVWNTSFFFNAPMGPYRAPTGVITLQLWDDNTLKDSHIATATLDLSQVQPAHMAYIELPLVWTKQKYGQQGRQSRLVVGVPGWVASFGTLMAATGHIPGALFNTVDRRAYLPLPSPTLSPGVVYLACEYEKDAVDLKVYICQPNTPLYVDLAMIGRQHTKVRRRVYSGGKAIMPGLTAYEEIKLDDVPLSTDLRQLLVLCFDKHLLWSGDSDRVVSAHGWKGALGFQQACRTLHSVEIDQSEQEIYMKIFDNTPEAAMQPPEALLLVDFDKDNVDIKLAVLDSPASVDKAWDLTINSRQTVKKTSEIFVPPKAKLGGKVQVSRICELDDVAYGTSFSNIVFHKFQLSNQRQWDVQSILPLR
eukprot:GHRR01002942.1.p1 GENE.GHRR01002942.1~~GHRR01002942.1.p1  ORF type:complete len:411 (+),score=107.49 GHRR01002942.1:318-1550(+)